MPFLSWMTVDSADAGCIDRQSLLLCAGFALSSRLCDALSSREICMFGSSILEIAIGMVFIYLLLSLICSVVNEGIASFLNKRGENLFDGIRNMLDDPKFIGLAQQLYSHGLVAGSSQHATDPGKPNRAPSYLPANTFAMALLDILASQGIGPTCQDAVAQQKTNVAALQTKLAADPGNTAVQGALTEAQQALSQLDAMMDQAAKVMQAHDDASAAAQQVAGPKDFVRLQIASSKLQSALAQGRALVADYPDPLGNIQNAVSTLPDGHTKQALLVMIARTKREAASVEQTAAAAVVYLEKLQKNIEVWFDNTMDRVSGWYKRWTQKILLIITILLVTVANADTLMLAKRLGRDNILRASVVTAAEDTVQNDASNSLAPQNAENLISLAENQQLPLGWIASTVDPFPTDQVPDSFSGWLMKLLGLLISICAVSMGAPFWFDTLSKFINIRSAGKPAADSRNNTH
jgi:hypothetical protein